MLQSYAFEKKFLLPLCHQPSETTAFQTYSGGGSKVGGGSKASPTPSPSPKGRGAAAHSECAARQGNAVFYAGKHRFLRKKTLFSLW